MIGFSMVKQALHIFPRAQLAAFARQALALLAATVEAGTPNTLEHAGEVMVFTDLDNFLAKIEAGPSKPASTPTAS